MAALRKATRHEHQLVAQSLGLETRSLSVGHYVRLIELFYGYYEPLEQQIANIPNLSQFIPDLELRTKVPRLVQDLRYWGHWEREEQRLPRCTTLPMIRDRLDALGCMYVTEGATLGGRILADKIRDELGITATTGAAFWVGYGSNTNSMWDEFGRLMSVVPQSSDDQSRIIASAQATFRTMRMWYEENIQ